MENPRQESQEPQADASKELAKLKIEDDDESEIGYQIEQLKASDDSEGEPIQNKADDMQDESEIGYQIEQLKASDDSEEEPIQNKADDMPDESEIGYQIEQLKASDDSEQEPIQNKADDMPVSYPYDMFDDVYAEILYDLALNNQLEDLPSLFTEESKAHYDNDSKVEFDDGDSSENSASPTDSTSKGQGEIQNTKAICGLLLYGFQLAATEGILETGEIDLRRFKKTKKANKMTNDFDEHSELWKGKVTPEAILLGEVRKMLGAIDTYTYKEIAKTYYRAQHQHTLEVGGQPVKIPVHIDYPKINEKWVDHLKNAIKSINLATPGILLVETMNKKESKIQIGVEMSFKHNGKIINPNKRAYTRNGGSFLNGENNQLQKQSTKMPFINLGGDLSEQSMKGTSIHELMHALSFHHEMQRPDVHKYLNLSEEAKSNHKKTTQPFGTKFDPFSIMMYKLGVDIERKEGDDIWNLKPSSERCQELSELNKVALNLIFKPCVTDEYKPTFNNKTKMLYCGRAVMINHNQVGQATSDYNCGPDNWANCPACRVIIRIEDEQKNKHPIPKLERCLKMDKWQGLSGVFYCGKEDKAFDECKNYPKKNNICGPDNGIPCTDCGQMLYKNYSMDVWDKLI